MNSWVLLSCLLLGACGKKSSEAAPSRVNDSAETDSAGTDQDTAEETPSHNLELSFVDVDGSWAVDQCATTCLTVRLTQEGEPLAERSVDLWVENTAIGVGVPTTDAGLATACADSLPTGDWRAVAVAVVDGDRAEAETPISVQPFGFADGIERVSGGGLPYTPNFARSDANPVFPPGASGSFDSVGTLLPSVVRTEDGWVMWYAGTADVDYSVGVARSDDGLVWLRRTAPTFPPDGEEGSWKRFATNAPMVVQDGLGWRVYYSGRAQESGDISIGMALGAQADGVTDYADNPVFGWSEEEASWAGQAVAHPAILRHPSGHWEMWYSTGLHKLGYAYSLDGVAWQRFCGNPVFAGNTGGSWEAHQAKAADVVFHDGWYLMAYTGGARGAFKIGWAMSRDGLNWTRADSPVFGPNVTPGTWESSSVLGPSLMVDGDTLRMWYGGTGLTGSAIGLATAALPATLEVTP